MRRRWYKPLPKHCQCKSLGFVLYLFAFSSNPLRDRARLLRSSFPPAFRRFVALKNKQNCFYSENALTFKSADKKLKALRGKDMDPVYNYAYYETAPAQWEFSTATASWTNGVTERMVGIFKKQFKIVMQKRICTISEMDVIIMEIVSFVNERPLGETNINDKDISSGRSGLSTWKYQFSYDH